MIGSVRGSVLARHTTGEVLVDVHGVGYRVLVPPRTLVGLEPGGDAFLYTHLHVRDDAFVLYGFATREERDTFEVVRGATGVGPKLALSILSVHEPPELRRALLDDDVDALTLVPGVGKRTAQRLLVELKAKFELPELESVTGGTPSPRGEVRAALAGLGYGADEVREVLAALDDGQPVEEMLRHALRQLAAQRAS